MLNDRGVGVRVSGRSKNFLCVTSSRPALGPVVKRQEREANHSPLTIAEVKKT
jgi:hypothetical protein